MRPIATDQDITRTPLNDLLGARANVRLLRLLANEVSGPVAAGWAADQVGLTEAGARRALKRLAETGFVEQIGGGRGQRFRLRDSDPLSRQLRALFQAEQARHEALMRELRQLFENFPEVEVAWIDDPPADVAQPMHVGFLADVQSLTYLEREIRRRIAPIEGEFDISIEIHTFSRAEMENTPWESKPILSGYGRTPNRGGEGSAAHADRADRSRRISMAIAELLDRDPSLRRRAERHLDVLLQQDQGAAAHDLSEWRNMLAHYSDPRLRDFLVADTARAQRLRQSSPFFAVLTHDEREEVLAMLESDT